MLEALPNLSELSVHDKDGLIVRLFAELTTLRAVVEDLQARVTSLEAENQSLRSENKELRGKLAKNSQNSRNRHQQIAIKNRSPRACANRAARNREGRQDTPERGLSELKNLTTRSSIRCSIAKSAATRWNRALFLAIAAVR